MAYSTSEGYEDLSTLQTKAYAASVMTTEKRSQSFPPSSGDVMAYTDSPSTLSLQLPSMLELGSHEMKDLAVDIRDAL